MKLKNILNLTIDNTTQLYIYGISIFITFVFTIVTYQIYQNDLRIRNSFANYIYHTIKKNIDSSFNTNIDTILSRLEQIEIQLNSMLLSQNGICRLNLKKQFTTEYTKYLTNKSISHKKIDLEYPWLKTGNLNELYINYIALPTSPITFIEILISWKTPFAFFNQQIFFNLFMLICVLIILSIITIALINQNFLTKPMIKEIQQVEESISLAEASQMLVHDLKKPFSIIKNLTSLITKHPNKVNDVIQILASHANEIQKITQQVDAMISDVLLFKQDIKLNLEAIDPTNIINTVIEDYTKHCSDIVVYKSLNHIHFVNVDILKIYRVLSNLIINALEAMNYKGKIWIKTTEYIVDNITMTEFCIGNSNSYIPPQHQSQIFNQFFTTKTQGSGLGLSIAQKIIKAHSGTIWVSSCPLKGTQFYFTVPTNLYHKRDLNYNNYNSIQTNYNTNFQIVIIDDNIFDLQLWKNTFKDASNVTLFIYQNPEQFIKDILETDIIFKINFVITDFYFDNDEICGVELAKKIKSKLDIPVICFTNMQPANLEELQYFDLFINKKYLNLNEILHRLSTQHKKCLNTN